MAIKTIRTDDLDGTEGAETVTFSLGPEAFEIDLSEKNAATLRKVLAPYIEAGRRTSSAKRSAKKSSARTPAAEATINNDAIRAWARANGHDVSDRGRVPANVKEAFDQAHAPSGSAKMFSAAGAN